MLTSSPYSVYAGFHPKRLADQPFDTPTRVRITLFECLEQRGFQTVFEISRANRLVLCWDLTKRKVVNEIKLQDTDDRHFLKTYLCSTDVPAPVVPPIDELVCIACKRNATGITWSCVFWAATTFTKPQLEEWVTGFVEPNQIRSVILVSEQPAKTQCHVIFDARPMLDVTFFSFDELKFNITQHILVPSYKIMTHDQVAKVGICQQDISRLPTLLSSDPICRFYAWPEGTILQIQPITGQFAPEYRIVRSIHTAGREVRTRLPPSVHVVEEVKQEDVPAKPVWKQTNIRQFLLGEHFKV